MGFVNRHRRRGSSRSASSDVQKVKKNCRWLRYGCQPPTNDGLRDSAGGGPRNPGRTPGVRGAGDGVTDFIGDATTVEDLQGKVVLPGFHDAHTHLVWSATELENVDLYAATTLDELLDSIAAQAAAK